ncbi:MAG: signal peptide peptidase SppA [Pirellulales bacterium]
MDPQPAPAPQQPVPVELVAEPSRGPIRVIVEPPRPSWWGRALRWILVILVGLWLLGSMGNYYGRDDDVQERWHSRSKSAADKIAIISVAGTIFGEQNFVKHQIDRVRDDDRVKAVVLRVDSPGGTVTGSDYIYHHLKQLTKDRQIPLVVSMGGIAASGGYYVSMAVGDAKDTIFAEPTTWTGSIGVIIPHYDVTGLLEKINVQDDSIASNPLKMMGSPTRRLPEPVRAEEQKILQELVDSSFADFKELVLSGRPALRDDQAAQGVVFTGRIFTAKQAQQNHLVDRLGFIEDAIDRASELAALDKENVQVVEFKQPQGVLDQMLFGPGGRSAMAEISALAELNVPRAYYLCTWLPGLSAGIKH